MAANANTNAGSSSVATGLSAQDRNFAMDAAMDGMTEVELGNLATQRGASDAVKQFGKTMVDDHSAANTELTQLASTKGITLPTALDAPHRALVNRMSKLSGAAFDRAYAKAMLSDHTKAVSKFERESTRGTDADLKAFVGKTLPKLRSHLEMARSLNTKAAKPAATSMKPSTTP
jgi:putative membrane protein